jgi:hypothetical protein
LSNADNQVVNGLHSQGIIRTCNILGFFIDQESGHIGLGIIKMDLYNYRIIKVVVRIEDGDTFSTFIYFLVSLIVIHDVFPRVYIYK